MRIIRNKTFETNSSSSHSLTLGSPLSEYQIPKKMMICDLEGGRTFEYSTVDERFSILASRLEIDEFFYLCHKLYQFGVEEIVLPNKKTFPYADDFYDFSISNWDIDPEWYDEMHSYLKNDDLLKRWLFSPDSEISGEDNNVWDWN